jgi:beta-galactosidase
MINSQRLNNDWYYKPSFVDEDITSGTENLERVHLPHTNIELPYNYFDEKMFQFISCYKKVIQLNELDSVHTIRFEGVMTKADVYLNGQYLGCHLGGYTPFEFNLNTAAVIGDNLLVVKVDSRELENIPPFGGQIDYLTYGGIYREVALNTYKGHRITKCKIETFNHFDQHKLVKLHLKLDVYNDDVTTHLGVKILKNGSLVKEAHVEVGFGESVLELDELMCDLWSLDEPNLYDIELISQSENGEARYTDRFGFRTCEFKQDGFYLNGQLVKIRGLNRHQSFPYVGYAMPKRIQEDDAEILKNQLHLNLVRTSHYPQSKHFLNKCDELGLLVFEEIPGWQHIGNQAWKQVAIENVKEMIERDWNHPSIIIWGVRINESEDDHDFYTSTNELARSLDTSRQTGGVRYIDNSEFLEDVYTMNDFVLDGGETALRDQRSVTGFDEHVPYLVTEYNGHMYPTKRFDQEERQMEHVLRHIRVQNASYADRHISGAIGWCAFDYNTHNDFGAGDRICYHGIMDMFRLEKFAASVYKSQVSPHVEPVLKAVTFWARGERAIGGVLPLIILTNCDYLELSFGGLKTFKLYRSEAYKELPYPPIIVDESVITPKDIGEWGMKWEDGHIKGYLDGECVIEEHFSKNPLPTCMQVKVNHDSLSSQEKDATRVSIELLDQMGQLMPFFDSPITIKIKGPAKLQGPNVLVAKGGAIAFYIETINEKGEIELTIENQILGTQTLYLNVI